MDILTRLKAVASRLVDQEQAEVIVSPQRAGTGHWFGGGNMVQDQNGTLWLTGRFRNQGDSRTGLGAGERGLETRAMPEWNARLELDGTLAVEHVGSAAPQLIAKELHLKFCR